MVRTRTAEIQMSAARCAFTKAAILVFLVRFNIRFTSTLGSSRLEILQDGRLGHRCEQEGPAMAESLSLH